MTDLHYDMEVSGRVQGVGFRYSALQMARRLGVMGFVKNMPGGFVYLEIEGTKIATDLMIQWCRTGPGTGRVKEVKISEGKWRGYDEFSVVY